MVERKGELQSELVVGAVFVVRLTLWLELAAVV